MKVLTQDALLVCEHELGMVDISPIQNLVTINQRKVLVENDPETRPIKNCPNFGPTIKPCLLTLRVEVGYSEFIRAEGRRICLDTVMGLTDGTPPASVKYKVNRPGQDFVSEVG